MNIKVGTYLEFENKNKIAKINSKEEDSFKLRVCSYGTTKEGYTYQSFIKVKTLMKKIKDGSVKTISPETILKILLKELT